MTPTDMTSIRNHRNWGQLLGPLSRDPDGSYSGVYRNRPFRVWKEFDERGRPLWHGRSGSIIDVPAGFHRTRKTTIRNLRMMIDQAEDLS